MASKNYEVPAFECIYDCWSGQLTRINYDDQEIALGDVYELCWYKSLEEYDGPYRLPEQGERFIECNPHGSDPYSLDQAKIYLEHRLAKLRDTVDAAHPYTLENVMLGWENMDDAELVWVHTSYARTPIFAIKLPAPKLLREPNGRLDALTRCLDEFADAELAIDTLGRSLTEEENLSDYAAYAVQLNQMLDSLQVLRSMIQSDHDVEAARGRYLESEE